MNALDNFTCQVCGTHPCACDPSLATQYENVGQATIPKTVAQDASFYICRAGSSMQRVSHHASQAILHDRPCDLGRWVSILEKDINAVRSQIERIKEFAL